MPATDPTAALPPTLNLIGGGRVARVLARLFASSAVLTVQDVLTRSQASADEAVGFIGAGRAAAALAQMRPAAVWMLAVSDDQIASVCGQLAAVHDLSGAVVFHCSGAQSSAALAGSGGANASIHPVRSFADPALVAARFNGTFCGIEGDPVALALLQPAFEAIGAHCVAIDPAAKTVYHAASVFASNYLVTVLDAALRAFQAAGIPDAVARQLAGPLARETLDNVLRLGPEAALTGPIARGDVATVQRQQVALSHWDAPTGSLYAALATATASLALRRSL